MADGTISSVVATQRGPTRRSEPQSWTKRIGVVRSLGLHKQNQHRSFQELHRGHPEIMLIPFRYALSLMTMGLESRSMAFALQQVTTRYARLYSQSAGGRITTLGPKPTMLFGSRANSGSSGRRAVCGAPASQRSGRRQLGPSLRRMRFWVGLRLFLPPPDEPIRELPVRQMATRDLEKELEGPPGLRTNPLMLLYRL